MMPTEMPETILITYEGLPVSSGGGHTIRGKNRLESWRRATGFIDAFTQIASESYYVEFYRGCKAAKKFLPEMKRQFGYFPRRENLTGGEKHFVWALDRTQAADAAKWIADISPLPEHWLGPIRLVRDAQYYLVDPESCEIIPNQGTGYDFRDGYGRMTSLSNFRLSMTNKVTLSLWLVLPFGDPTGPFESFVRQLAAAAPFKLSNKHWKRWQYSKTGNLYPRKLEIMPAGR